MKADRDPVAFSYVRFSYKPQEMGDSIRRQVERTTAWAERNGVPLEALAPDKGIPAFRGKNRSIGSLGAFLKMVERGRVLPGDFLVVESLDRLTREEVQQALLLILGMLQRGVRVVQLLPQEWTYDNKSDTVSLILMIVELSRSNSESQVKSVRVADQWAERRKAAREEGTVMTRRLPAWIKERNGKLAPIRDRVKVIQNIFKWLIAGDGLGRIVRRLTEAKVKPWGKAKGWSKAYVKKIITGRAVRGEMQPYTETEVRTAEGRLKRVRVPDGPPLQGYYPVVIDEPTWEAAQDVLAARGRGRPGRVGEKVANLFSGLLTDARTQEPMLICSQGHGRSVKGEPRRRVRVLCPVAALEGRVKAPTFNHGVFEAALISLLREVPVADVAGEEPAGESAQLEDRLRRTEQRIRRIDLQLLDVEQDVDEAGVMRVRGSLEEQRQDLERRLRVARQAEQNPLTARAQEAKSLLEVLEDEEARMRFRELIPTVVDAVWVLVVKGRGCKWLAVQVYFASGVIRSYLVHYRPGTNGRAAESAKTSFALALPDAGDLDLRRQRDVAKLEKVLQRLDLSDLV
jgi:DNA invertase Pin-like site-specific DNA recombinase